MSSIKACTGSEWCIFKFWGQIPKKTEILRARIGLSSLNEKKFKSLQFENYLADHYEIFTRSTHHERAFVGGLMAYPKQIQDGGIHHL